VIAFHQEYLAVARNDQVFFGVAEDLFHLLLRPSDQEIVTTHRFLRDLIIIGF